LILEEEKLVKKTCKELGITQKELAEITGIAEKTLRNWTYGQKIPKWAFYFFDILQKYEEQKNTINLFKEFNRKLEHTGI
jgi:transcriptional regulator with XRE-family HTH domain